MTNDEEPDEVDDLRKRIRELQKEKENFVERLEKERLKRKKLEKEGMELEKENIELVKKRKKLEKENKNLKEQIVRGIDKRARKSLQVVNQGIRAMVGKNQPRLHLQSK
jgi:septal ring factor EnvC (AmiA/AmiB activator)